MIQQLLVALALASITVVIHAVGTVHAALPASGIWGRAAGHKLPGPVMALTRLVSALLILHLIEMAIWGAMFSTVGVLPDFETALYFSTVTFASLGYGDVLLSHDWRLFGAIEAANGLILFGWSTAFLLSVMARLRALEHDWSEH